MARVRAALITPGRPLRWAAEAGLLTIGLIERLPAPGSRREHYRLRDDAWATLFTIQNTVIQAMLQAAVAGIAATESGDPAHQRLARMHAFYGFLLGEIPSLLDR